MNIVLRYKDTEGIDQDIIIASGYSSSANSFVITNASLTEAGKDFVKYLGLTAWMAMCAYHFSVLLADEKRTLSDCTSGGMIFLGPDDINKDFNGEWTMICID